MTLPESVRAWEARGGYDRYAGREIFHVEVGPETGDVVVILHGFPTSTHDWHRTVDQLGDRRILLLDLPGYGLSEKPTDYSYSLFEQADVVEVYLREQGVSEAHVVAHDMGTSVACELMARRERGLLTLTPRSLLLMNGSVHIEMAKLTPSQRLLRSPAKNVFAKLGSWFVFRTQLRRILGRDIGDDELAAMWAQLLHRDGKLRLPTLIEYVGERSRFAERWIGALTRLDVPAHVLWGTEDPVAVLTIAETLAREIPGARLERLEGLGHYPQLEDPERTAGAIRRWLDAASG